MNFRFNSFLSPKVDHLLRIGISSKFEPDYFQNGIFINCKKLEVDFDSIESNLSHEIYYERLIKCIAPLISTLTFNLIHLEIGLKLKQNIKCGQYLNWMKSNSSIVDQAFHLLENKKPECLKLSLLLLTSAIERSLGNLILIKINRVPPLLKDILSLPELDQIIGPTLNKCLLVMIGPPISLNIRNLLWHGFILDDQIELFRSYFYFIISILLSIGKNFCLKYDCNEIPERDKFDYFSRLELDNYYPILDNHDLTFIANYIIKAKCIHPKLIGTWNYSIQLFQNSNYGHSLTLFLPLFEFILRSIYGTLNQCSASLLTAQCQQFYITFASILGPFCADKTKNKFISSLPSSLIELLMDLILLPLGLRVRDKLSHGIVNLDTISKNIANFILCSIIGIILLTSCEDHSHLESSNIISHIKNLTLSYRSLYHPLAVLRNDLIKLSQSIEPLMNFFNPLKLVDLSQNLTFLTSICNLNNLTLSCLFELLNNLKLNTIFRKKSETELTKLHQLIVDSLQISVNQVNQTFFEKRSKLFAKQLRSHQRINLNKLETNLEQYLNCILILIFFEYNYLSKIDQFSLLEDSRIIVVKKLKKLLKYCQNMINASDKKRNKWDALIDLTKLILNQLIILDQLKSDQSD